MDHNLSFKLFPMRCQNCNMSTIFLQFPLEYVKAGEKTKVVSKEKRK